jgi:hypothetical protein
LYKCLITHHVTKTYGGVKVHFYAFLSSVLDRDKWTGSSPGRFTPQERTAVTHWTEGCEGLQKAVRGSRTCLDAMAKNVRTWVFWTWMHYYSSDQGSAQFHCFYKILEFQRRHNEHVLLYETILSSVQKDLWNAHAITFSNNKKFWKELICLFSLHYLKMSFALKLAFAPT